MLQRVGRNVLSLGLSRIVSGIILFVVYTRLATYLGPGDFGKFSLVIAYFMIFSLVVDFGISRYVIKKVSEDQTVASLYLGNFVVAQIFLSLFILLLFAIIPKVLGYEGVVARSMFLVALGLLLSSLSIPFSSIIQAWQRIHIVAVVNFLDTLIRALWFALAIILREGIVFIFLGYIIIGFMDLLIYIFSAKRIVVPKLQIQKNLITKMFCYGLPFAFISGFEILISKIDSIIQKQFLPFFEVGLYSAAYRFLDFLTFIPAIVAITLFPYLAEKINLETEEVPDTLNRFNRYMMALAIPLGVGATLLGDKIILTLFDTRYLGAILPFQILIWATVLTFIYAVPNVMMIVRQTGKTVVILLLVAAFNIIFNWLMVPHFGILASAFLTVVSYLLVTFLYVFYARQLASFCLFRYAPWPILASLVMGFFIWFLRDMNIFLLATAGTVIYFAILVIAGFVKREDWLFLKSVFKRS